MMGIYQSFFLNSYSKAFNKQKGRRGSLFMHPFKRKIVQDDDYFRRLIHYIHFNPVVAGLCKYPHQWEFSSYNAIIQNRNSLLKKEIVLDLFQDLENFMYMHQKPLTKLQPEISLE
jgi:putative transposase